MTHENILISGYINEINDVCLPIVEGYRSQVTGPKVTKVRTAYL